MICLLICVQCVFPGLLRIKKGQVVLAGDPKQLGPIVKSKVAERQGLGEFLTNDLSLQMSKSSYLIM